MEPQMTTEDFAVNLSFLFDETTKAPRRAEGTAYHLGAVRQMLRHV